MFTYNILKNKIVNLPAEILEMQIEFSLSFYASILSFFLRTRNMLREQTFAK